MSSAKRRRDVSELFVSTLQGKGRSRESSIVRLPAPPCPAMTFVIGAAFPDVGLNLSSALTDSPGLPNRKKFSGPAGYVGHLPFHFRISKTLTVSCLHRKRNKKISCPSPIHKGDLCITEYSAYSLCLCAYV